MEYAKDEIFSVQYNQTRNQLEFKNKEERKGVSFFKKNRFIKIITVLTLLFSSMNVVLIYQFWNLLTTF